MCQSHPELPLGLGDIVVDARGVVSVISYSFGSSGETEALYYLHNVSGPVHSYAHRRADSAALPVRRFALHQDGTVVPDATIFESLPERFDPQLRWSAERELANNS